jgi:phage terminase large subunit-like protein
MPVVSGCGKCPAGWFDHHQCVEVSVGFQEADHGFVLSVKSEYGTRCAGWGEAAVEDQL